MLETKVHYKSYKAGKRWLYAAISVTSLCAGLALTVPANAATTDSDSTPVTETVNADSSSNNENATNSNVDPANTNGSSDTSNDVTNNGSNDDANTNNITDTDSNNNANTNDVTDDNSNSDANTNDVTDSNSNNNANTNDVTDDNSNDDTTNNVNADSTDDTDTNGNTDEKTQLSTPQDLASASDITDPLLVKNSGAPQDQSQDKLNLAVSVTATNAKGTQTSKDSTQANNQVVAVNTDDTSLNVTYTITNQTDTSQGLWMYITFPAYLNHTTDWTVAPTADASNFANVPDSVQQSFLTTDDGTYYQPSGFDWTTLKEVQLKGSLNAGDQYTVTLPITIPATGKDDSTLQIISFTPEWKTTTVNLTAVDPVISSGDTDTDNPDTDTDTDKPNTNTDTDNPDTHQTDGNTDETTQLSDPQDLASAPDITDPLLVKNSGAAQDQSQDKVNLAVSVTATNAKGTQTSKDSTQANNQVVAVNTDDTTLNVTYTITNQTDTSQGLWMYVVLPAYSDNATAWTVAPTAGSTSFAGVPDSVQQSFLTTTTNGTYYQPSGFDWTTLKEIQLQGSLDAGDQYTITLPIVIPAAGTGNSTLQIISFTPEWKSTTVNLTAVDPVSYHAPTNLPTATPQTPTATVDPDVTEPTPAITNNPDLQEKTNTAPVDATIRITAKNENGSSTSLTSHADTHNNASMVIVDSHATDLTALFDLTNTTDTIQAANTFFSLPTYYNNRYPTHTSVVTMANDVNINDLISDLPTGLAVHFVVGDTEYNSYSDMLAADPDFQWSDLTQFHVVGQLAAKSGYTLNVPLSVQKTDPYTIHGGSIMSQYSFGAVQNDDGFYFRIADQEDDLNGNYQAVLVNPNDDGNPYVAAPADVQAAMPKIGQDQVSYHNFFSGSTGSTTDHPYTGGIVTINYQNADFADAINHLGYAVTLGSNGQPYELMSYLSDGNPSLIENPTENPLVYVIVRQVLQAQDKTLQVGDNWNQLDNFVAGFDNQDQPLQASDIQVTQISDPSGIVKDGKVTAAGTFTVTYAYQVADDYYGKGEPYMVYKTATVTVDAPDPVDPTPTDPDNPGTTTPTDPSTDPDNPGTTTPTDPGTDPDNPGTTTPTDPSTDPDNPGTTTPTDPSTDPNNPGTTTPVDPSTPTNPDTTTGNETAVTGGSGDTVTVTTPSATTDDSAETIDANAATTATPLVTSGNADSVNTTQESTTSAKVIHGGDGATVTTGKSSVATNQAKVQTATPATATTLNAQTTTPKATATAATSTQLPQTNEAKPNGLAILGMGLLTGALSLVGLKSRKHD
ncbi:KxYKxGKxW signal peptide domain-containing protein [Levilactobacillus namurensis]|uniref:KxYKxGKxW signal peptide domain-containing protein n=1 Tax=Levilactobacillus namurensis TaxID=380393 RepID=UPI0026EB1035|nr:KxYKxGKxW signal peptide domain-containing protein [Levilactobacillus namurensis]